MYENYLECIKFQFPILKITILHKLMKKKSENEKSIS